MVGAREFWAVTRHAIINGLQRLAKTTGNAMRRLWSAIYPRLLLQEVLKHWAEDSTALSQQEKHYSALVSSILAAAAQHHIRGAFTVLSSSRQRARLCTCLCTLAVIGVVLRL